MDFVTKDRFVLLKVEIMKCPGCKGEKWVKNGIVKNKQRYRCKACQKNFTVELKSTAATESKRRIGLIMHLEGVGVSSIGRLLGVSHVAVIKWTKKYGESLKPIKNCQSVIVNEVADIHTNNAIEYSILLTEQSPKNTISFYKNVNSD